MIGRVRWAFWGTIACSFILLGLATQRGALLALAIPFLVFLFSSFYLGGSLVPILKATRTLSTSRAQSGEEVTVHIEITNEGSSVEEIEIIDSIPSYLERVAGEPRLITTLKSGETAQIEYTVRGRRGFAQWNQLSITAGDHLGLRRRFTKVSCQGHLFVLPNFPKLYEVEIRPRRTRVYSGSVRTKLGGPGIEFFGIREYYPGDALRHLNWKATAHYDQPITNEFEQERVADIGIVLDCRERTEVSVGGDSLFEQAVGAASALADFFISRGNRLGLLVYGDYIDWTFPGFGRLQREKLLQSLARAELSNKTIFEDLENIPTKLFPAGSQLVIVSSLCEDDVEILLQLCGLYHVIVVSPNPILFELSRTHPTDAILIASRIASLRREIVLSQLRQAGIRLVDWDTQSDLPIPVEQALGRHTLRHQQAMRGRP
ncbi:DUF58 domain-containing protein [Candidatus Acetothermia bacterium]|nr:DUF58 domain-containing protein [Candidatus Acetothermia bacterium]